MSERLVIDSIMLKPFGELPTGIKAANSKKWTDLAADLIVRFVGVGSAACDIVRYLSAHTHYDFVNFIAVDQDLAALKRSEATTQVLLKSAGSEPAVAANAAAQHDFARLTDLADLDEIQQLLAGSDMVCVLTDLGECSAVGVALDLVQVARATGALTMGIGLQPLSCDSQERLECAQYGQAELEAKVDTLFVIDPNQLLPQTGSKLSDVRAEVNSVALHILLGLIEPCVAPVYICFDFSEILTIFKGRGRAAIGFAQASGDNFVLDAVKQAIRYPLLEPVDLKKASGLLVNARINRNFPIVKWEQINREIQNYADEEADCKYSIVFDDQMAEDQIAISILISGISGGDAPKNENPMAAVRSNANSRRKVPPQVNDDGADPEMPYIFRKKV
ncbi:MAG: hypothetical protein ROM54_01045 [Anaerobiospirillum sp.]|nr:hypothetical protein [Anaerobiospirillum sp.]